MLETAVVVQDTDRPSDNYMQCEVDDAITPVYISVLLAWHIRTHAHTHRTHTHTRAAGGGGGGAGPRRPSENYTQCEGDDAIMPLYISVLQVWHAQTHAHTHTNTHPHSHIHRCIITPTYPHLRTAACSLSPSLTHSLTHPRLATVP